MFELCRLRCEYAELHVPSSFGLDELLMYTRNEGQGWPRHGIAFSHS